MTDIITFPIPTTTITPVMASPPPIGSTTPNTGAFTTLQTGGVATAPSTAIVATTTDDITPAGTPAAARLGVYNGSAASPVTATDAPSVVIGRVESLASAAGSHSSALLITNTGLSSTTQQVQANSLFATTAGTNDVVGLFVVTANSGPATKVAFGAYLEARGNSASTGAVALETASVNNSGVDRPYSPTVGVNLQIGCDITYNGGAGNNLGSVAYQCRGKWDVGYAVLAGANTVSSDFRSDSGAIAVLTGNGTHTNGIDLSGGTYSGSTFKSTGFSVDSTGILSALNYNYNGGAWTTYTATLTPNVGSVSQTGTASYLQIGKLVHVSIDVTMTVTSGVPTSISVAVPVGPKRQIVLVGREAAVTGSIIQVTVGAGSTSGSIGTYNNGSSAASGSNFCFTGVYEAL